MTIQDLGSIGEFVAAIATVITLGYLALQIRQNTRSMRESAFQASTGRAADLTMSLAQDTDLLRIFRTGLLDTEQLDEEDRGRFIMLKNTTTRYYEGIFFQYRSSTLEFEGWDAWQASFRPIVEAPGFAQFWAVRSDAFTASFRKHIEMTVRASSEKLA